MGDIDVIYVDGLYHLFHLVLPNHDFIAHSISIDGIDWQRIHNAIFIGDPGAWDDSMLWTMHVSPDPAQAGCWRMFYTGLSRSDRQLKQRIGLATSLDLIHWTKAASHWPAPIYDLLQEKLSHLPETKAVVMPLLHHPAELEQQRQGVREVHCQSSPFPLEAIAQYYEASLDVGRRWISWRDPYFFQYGERRLLLCSARTNSGAIVRRGCVGLLEENELGQFEPRPALFHPGLYDDIEVPNLIEMDATFYLIGSIREDAKIRYWHSTELDGPWASYHDNVLLPQGNYAARICQDDRGYLIWNVFSMDASRKQNNVMPPPKRLIRRSDGLLEAVSFEAFEKRLLNESPVSTLAPLRSCGAALHPRATTQMHWLGDTLHLKNDAGFQGFVFQQDFDSVRLRARIKLIGLGKCGLLLRLDRETYDGYYISLDLHKGIAQVRDWGTDHQAAGELVMQFRSLQSAYWHAAPEPVVDVELLAFGSYLELSLDGRVVLSLVDHSYQAGALGFYLESAHAEISRMRLESLAGPTHPHDYLTVG